jgi:hypothetical protein
MIAAPPPTLHFHAASGWRTGAGHVAGTYGYNAAWTASPGVVYTPGGATTDSIVMRSRSGTVRRVVAQQSLAKLSSLTGFEYL